MTAKGVKTMNENLARFITFIVFAAAASISIYFRHQAEQNGNPMRSAEGGKFVAVLRLIGLLLLVPFVGYLINPDWVAWARFSVPDGLRWLAAGVALTGIPMVYWVFSNIGDNISPTQATREKH